MKYTTLSLILVLLGLSAAAGAGAQTAEWELSRDSLSALLSRYRAAGESPAYGPEVRGEAHARADAVERRLREGDFQPGDFIIVRVERQPLLTDTFAVTPGPELVLPVVGPVPLAGLLRSELEGAVMEAVGRVILDAVGSVDVLTRIGVLGEVAAPGFYMLPTDAVLTDVLMRAGGPTREADMAGARLERTGELLLSPVELRQATEAGLTLTQLDLRPGDQLIVPRLAPTASQRFQLVVMSIPAIMLLLTLF